MNIIVKDILNELRSMYDIKKPRTGEVRSLSSRTFKQLPNKDINYVFKLCTELLEQKSWASGVIAYDWAFRMRNKYNENTFNIFNGWLHNYIKDWGDCDDFCTHAFGALLAQDNKYFDKILKWADSSNFAVRRATAVTLLYPIKKNKYAHINPLLVSDILMHDEHYLVQKGYGWMLKVLSLNEPDKVFNYLIKHKSKMPRTAFRYSLEKLDSKKKEILMDK